MERNEYNTNKSFMSSYGIEKASKTNGEISDADTISQQGRDSLTTANENLGGNA